MEKVSKCPPSVVREMHGFYILPRTDSLKERIESLESSVFGIVAWWTSFTVSVARSLRGRFSKRENESFVFGIIAWWWREHNIRECPPHSPTAPHLHRALSSVTIKSDISCTRHLEVYSLGQ
jgi:hypothetical protein